MEVLPNGRKISRLQALGPELSLLDHQALHFQVLLSDEECEEGRGEANCDLDVVVVEDKA